MALDLNKITSIIDNTFATPTLDAGYEINDNIGLGSTYGDYQSKVMPEGVSRKNQAPIEGQVWNPGSETAADYFLKNAGTYASLNPDYYKNSYIPTYEKLKKAKTDNERFAILENAQKERQNSFASTHQNLAKKVGSSYAPTQTGLQYLYDNLQGDDKANFETALKNSNIPFKNGKVLGGYYQVKGNKEDDTLYKELDNIKTKNADLYDKYSISNITDGKWDRRLENFQGKDFYSIAERDKYFSNENFDKAEDNGKIFYVDKKNPNNIIDARVYRDKKVSPEEITVWNEKESQYNFGENGTYKYKNLGEAGVYDRYYTDAPVEREPLFPSKAEETTTEKKDVSMVNQNIKRALYRNTPEFYQRPPSSLTIFPEYMQKTEMVDPIKVTPEEAIRENNRALELSTLALGFDTSDAVGANLAQIQYRTMMSNNDAAMKAEEINATNALNAENQNVVLRNAAEVNKANYIKGYNDQVARAILNTENELSNYEGKEYDARVKQFETEEKLALYDKMFPNTRYNVGNGVERFSTGDVIYTDPLTAALAKQVEEKEANKAALEKTKAVKKTTVKTK